VKVSVRCSLNRSAFSTSVAAKPPWRLIMGTSGGLYFSNFLEAVQRLPLLDDKLERWFTKDWFLCLASIFFSELDRLL